MAAALVPHIVTVDTQKARVELPDEYADIGELVGIVKDDPASPAKALPSKVSGLIAGGSLVRINCRVQVGGVFKYRTVLCSVSKLATALGSLTGKVLPGSGGEATIKRTGFKGRRRLG